MPRTQPSNTSRVVISGFGLITPLGHSAWETFSALLAGRTISDRSADLPPDIDPVRLVQALGSVSVARHTPTDPAVELAERAAREAMFMAKVGPGDVGCIVGASKGATHALLAACEGQKKTQGHRGGRRSMPKPHDADLAVALGPHGYLCHHLSQRLGVKAVPAVVAACASSLTALHVARMSLLGGSRLAGADRVLVVTVEASLLPLFIHSYRRLGVLMPLTAEGYRGYPLDHRRRGFLLSELAAAVVLERVDRPRPGQIELVDTAVASESYDLIRTAPDMAALSRVAQQLLQHRTIDLLHPHATGTTEHDPAELAAVAPHLTGQPDVYACKGALGHGLGAAGLVSLVLACLCATTGRRPPMPWLEQPIEAGNLKLQHGGQSDPQTMSTHAVFAAGFAGHVAGAVVRQEGG